MMQTKMKIWRRAGAQRPPLILMMTMRLPRKTLVMSRRMIRQGLLKNLVARMRVPLKVEQAGARTEQIGAQSKKSDPVIQRSKEGATCTRRR